MPELKTADNVKAEQPSEPEQLDSELKADSYEYRRAPAVPRLFSQIDPENDIRIAVTGSIIDKSFGSLIVDDGEQQKEIIADFDVAREIGELICVFARVLPLEEGYELRAELVQDMAKLDFPLYKKIIFGR